jgi:hypothetical protein
MIPPSVYCIHSTDAPQHLGKMQTMMSQFKGDNRIENFVALEIDSALTNLEGRFKAGDVLVLFLTLELDKRRKDILNLVRRLKSRFMGTVIVEIVVDNIPLENEHITLPQDLKPIRDTQNMDLIWTDIEQNLRDILPAHATSKGKPVSKYVKYGIIIGILLILLLWRPWKSSPPPPTYIEPVPDARADTSAVK